LPYPIALNFVSNSQFCPRKTVMSEKAVAVTCQKGSAVARGKAIYGYQMPRNVLPQV
jgi:hypothetical protein